MKRTVAYWLRGLVVLHDRLREGLPTVASLLWFIAWVIALGWPIAAVHVYGMYRPIPVDRLLVMAAVALAWLYGGVIPYLVGREDAPR